MASPSSGSPQSRCRSLTRTGSRYLEVRGRIERIIPDPEGAEFVRLAVRYGMPQGPPPDAANRVAVAIRPEHTTTQ